MSMPTLSREPLHPHLVEAVRWALTLLRFDIAKHGLPGDRVSVSECHGMLTGETPMAPLRGRIALALSEIDGAEFGVRRLGELARATLTVDVRGRMVFGATLDLMVAPELETRRSELADAIVLALREQEPRLMHAILR